MSDHLTSAYGGDRLTVSEMMKDPTWIPEQALTEIDGSFLEEAIFRNGGTNQGVVAFREAAAPYLNDNAEHIAEFAEIPVSDGSTGKLRSIIGVKQGLAIRVSREMIKFNRTEAIDSQVKQLQNTLQVNGIEEALKAFDVAGVTNLALDVDWEDNDGNPVLDLRRAKRLISLAKHADRENALYGYQADTIVAHPATIDLALFHDSVQKFYNGNMANENPLFKGDVPASLLGLRVVTSPYITEGTAYVLQSGTAGFISEADPLTLTPMYSENGENGFGGSNQSFRTDAFRNRVIAVDNPKSVVKITGIEA